MLKRIALAAVLAVSAAFVGVGVAHARTSVMAPTISAPKGFCPRGNPCVVAPTVDVGTRAPKGFCPNGQPC
jgi:hypothetical protein